MPLTDAELQRLCDFVGYGHLDAQVWFLGMEEAGGGEANIRTRLEFAQVEDCAEAHRNLGMTQFHEGRRRIQPTWRGMCCLMLCLENKPVNRPAIRKYQAERLGRSSGKTLQCEMMPIPKHNMHTWGYEDLIPQYKSRDHYYETVLPQRIELLRGLHKKHQPPVVIAYGKQYWPKYQKLFQSLDFQEREGFLVAENGKQVVVLIDHFVARTMNNRHSHVAEIVRSYYTA